MIEPALRVECLTMRLKRRSAGSGMSDSIAAKPRYRTALVAVVEVVAGEVATADPIQTWPVVAFRAQHGHIGCSDSRGLHRIADVVRARGLDLATRTFVDLQASSLIPRPDEAAAVSEGGRRLWVRG